MDLDRAIARDSALHRADPRAKFPAVVAAIVAIGLLPVGGWVAFGMVWLALVGASALARLGPFRLSRGAFVAVPFMLVALPLIFVRTGDPLGRLGPLTVSGEGLTLFATIALKSWLSVQVALLLTFTTPFHDLVDALGDLRVPRILVAIISFMYRYLAVIGQEAARMTTARAARSASSPSGRVGGSLAWRARVTGGMVGSLFVRSYERSERIYAAMLARGFDGTYRHLAAQPVGPGTWAWLVALAALLIGFVVTAHLWLPHA
jgi:cobalt/nickel transport system permease protein